MNWSHIKEGKRMSKDKKFKPLGKLEKKVFNLVGRHPGIWNIYAKLPKEDDRTIDRAIATLQSFGYLKHVGTSHGSGGRTTWHLTDLGLSRFRHLNSSIADVEFTKQEDGSYQVTTSVHPEGPGKVKKIDNLWYHQLPPKKNQSPTWDGGSKTRNKATEVLLDVAYSG